MTPADLARLHAACFTTPRPWSEAEIAGLLDSPFTFLLTEPAGFLLGRVIADEAELLTLAVDPAARRQGNGRRLVAAFLAEARRRGATTVFLEVARSNPEARALYAAAGFAETGCRPRYYGPQEDALILSHPLSA